jgi:hypothetical protein
VLAADDRLGPPVAVASELPGGSSGDGVEFRLMLLAGGGAHGTGGK